jgi:hypothetical protein
VTRVRFEGSIGLDMFISDRCREAIIEDEKNGKNRGVIQDGRRGRTDRKNTDGVDSQLVNFGVPHICDFLECIWRLLDCLIVDEEIY